MQQKISYRINVSLTSELLAANN